MRPDKSLLEAIFKTHYQSLCKTSYRILRDQDLVEDIVQDVFCEFWQKNQTVELQEPVLPYFHKAVINRSLNYLRGHKNRDTRETIYGNSVYEEKNFTEELLLLKDLKIKVHKVIDKLPPACRAVFILSRFENLKYKEIASQLNISVKTVENHMLKALKHIRQHLSVVLFTLFIIYFFIE